MVAIISLSRSAAASLVVVFRVASAVVPPFGGQRGGPGGNRGPNGGSNQQNTVPTMTFRAQFQNLLNNVQYGNYIGTMTSPFFGRAISTARPARQIELGLRFNF